MEYVHHTSFLIMSQIISVNLCTSLQCKAWGQIEEERENQRPLGNNKRKIKKAITRRSFVGNRRP